MTNAYLDGLRDGHADRFMRTKSIYAWAGVFVEPPGTYSYEYSRGYHAGFCGLDHFPGVVPLPL